LIPALLGILSSLFRYNTHGVLNVAAGFFDLSVGLIVLLNNPKSRIGRSFFPLTLVTSIWVTSFGLQNLVRSPAQMMTCQAIAYLGGVPFIPACFYFFSTTWIDRKRNTLSMWLMFGWSVAAMVPMVFFTSSIVGIQEYAWGWFPYFLPSTSGHAYAAFLLIPFFFNAFLLITAAE
jgi:hypothetical protein